MRLEAEKVGDFSLSVQNSFANARSRSGKWTEDHRDPHLFDERTRHPITHRYQKVLPSRKGKASDASCQ